MADIELAIKIPEEIYNRYMNYTETYVDFMFFGTEEKVVRAIQNGTPLPKGHGKLKDADELYGIFQKLCDGYNIDNLSFISDMDMNFDLATTIVDADKVESEEKDIRSMIKDATVIENSLCDSCINNSCIFQSGIVRSHCDFYRAESEE